MGGSGAELFERGEATLYKHTKKNKKTQSELSERRKMPLREDEGGFVVFSRALVLISGNRNGGGASQTVGIVLWVCVVLENVMRQNLRQRGEKNSHKRLEIFGKWPCQNIMKQ